MLLLGSLFVLGSAAGMLQLGAYPLLGELAALTFVVSAFVGVCAAEAPGGT